MDGEWQTEERVERKSRIGMGKIERWKKVLGGQEDRQ